MKDTGEETKKCKYCQSDIPKKAKVCPRFPERLPLNND